MVGADHQSAGNDWRQLAKLMRSGQVQLGQKYQCGPAEFGLDFEVLTFNYQITNLPN